ncbi:aspartyl-phosphate phosphatase Spo0E family protein [Alteribacter natronophilus]|uniref:aspartyl-phosphate phosphatase Spo0E family protein n=1 Tax=Alteribacter natronophilus TaxID=2583810 RepID=UPI00110F34D6|nr:aspartyl-phosphate phosphatase Spo0E family protein [Alteribacter natronophilus]TMW70402.1 aspartyl-phosphate phosphatase Spo0E family protein [Alteribacter natronophilus]
MVLVNDLKRFVEEKRALMMESARKNGLTAEETVRYSQELDELLNRYQKLSGQDSRYSESAGSV